jgi:hypothetical protein
MIPADDSQYRPRWLGQAYSAALAADWAFCAASCFSTSFTAQMDIP